MSKLIKLFILLSFITLSACTINSHYKQKQQIRKMIKPVSEKAFTGIDIRELSSGDILFQSNVDMIFTPASTMKLFTTYLALKQNGTDFRFNTKFYISRSGKDSLTAYNLYIKASGDPTLGSVYTESPNSRHFSQWYSDLIRKGIHTIQGDIYLIKSGKTLTTYRPGWLYDDFGLAFQNEITEFSYQNNLVYLNIKSDSSTILIEQDTLLLPLPVDNQTRISENNQVRFKQELFKNPVISGTLSPNATYPLRVSISGSEKYFLESFRQYLQKQDFLTENATLHFIQRDQICDDSLRLILQYTSPPLDSICQIINKFSINSYAEQINTFLINPDFRQKEMTEMGIDLKTTVFDDGSGLSVYNKIKPSDFSKLCYQIFHSELFPVYLNTLSAGGEDGTLKNRISKKEFKGRVFGKSGSMRNINNVVAFYHSPQDKWYSIIILINNIPAGTNVNDLLELLCGVLP